MNTQTNINLASCLPIETMNSDELFGDASIVNINHQGMTYTLRITRQGKLLLTK